MVKKKTTLLEMSRTLTGDSMNFKPFPRFEPIEIHLSKGQKSQLFSERYFERNNPDRKKQLSPEEKFWVGVEKFNALETASERRVFMEAKKGWPKFKEVFMISALDGDGTGELKVRRAFHLSHSFTENMFFHSKILRSFSELLFEDSPQCRLEVQP